LEVAGDQGGGGFAHSLDERSAVQPEPEP